MSQGNIQEPISETGDNNNLIIDHKNSMFAPEEPSPSQITKRTRSPTEELEETITTQQTNTNNGRQIKKTTSANNRKVLSNESYRTIPSSSSSLRPERPQQDRLSQDNGILHNNDYPPPQFPNLDIENEDDIIIDPTTNNPYKQKKPKIIKKVIDIPLYKETKLYGLFVDITQIEGSTHENKMESFTELISASEFFFNTEKVIHNEETYLIANFTDETAKNIFLEKGEPLTKSKETLFHNYEGIISIEKLQKRRKLEKANRSIKLEAIPNHISIQQLITCIQINYGIKVTDTKEIKKNRESWAYAAFLTLRSFEDVGKITNDYQNWAIRIMARDIKISPVCITQEEKFERKYTLKLTGLLENTHVTEISPLTRELNSKCTIIPERQLPNGNIKKDNVAFITVPEKDYSEDIVEYKIGNRTYYTMHPNNPACNFCGNPTHHNQECKDRSSAIRDSTVSQYHRTEREEPLTSDMRQFLDNKVHRPSYDNQRNYNNQTRPYRGRYTSGSNLFGYRSNNYRNQFNPNKAKNNNQYNRNNPYINRGDHYSPEYKKNNTSRQPSPQPKHDHEPEHPEQGNQTDKNLVDNTTIMENDETNNSEKYFEPNESMDHGWDNTTPTTLNKDLEETYANSADRPPTGDQVLDPEFD